MRDPFGAGRALGDRRRTCPSSGRGCEQRGGDAARIRPRPLRRVYPMTVASPAMRELDLEAEGVRWISPPAIMAHPFDDGTAIVLHRELAATVASLDTATSRVGARVGRTDRAIPPAGGPSCANDPRAVVPGSDSTSGRVGRDVTSRRAAIGPAHDRLDRGVRPRPVRRRDSPDGVVLWIGTTFWARPSTAGSGAFGFLLQLLAHSHGWPFPAGGQGRIIDALMSIATREGVQVRCDAPVQRILVRGGRVGVRLRGGEELAARDVVTTISARPLAGMLTDDALPEQLLRRLRILVVFDRGVQARLCAGASRAVDGHRGSTGGGGARRRRAGRPGRGG